MEKFMPKTTMETRLAVAVMLSLIAIMFYLMGFQNSFTFENKQVPKLVTATGYAEKEVMPDITIVDFVIFTEEKDLNNAKTKNKDIEASIKKNLADAGLKLEEMTTSYFNTNPMYDYSFPVNAKDSKEALKERQPIGYRVENGIEVRIDGIDKVDTIINALTSQNNVSIRTTRYDIKDINKEKDLLITDAVTNAKSKAEYTVKPTNQKIMGLYSATIGNAVSSGYNSGVTYGMSSAKVASSSTADFGIAEGVSASDNTEDYSQTAPKKVKITMNVNASFELK